MGTHFFTFQNQKTMNVKNLMVGTLVGGIVYWLLGWVFYGMLFKDIYPDEGQQNIVFLFLGCLTFAFLLTYIFIQWASISTPLTGLKAGALIGLLYGLSMNFFIYSTKELNLNYMALDTVINAVMAGIAGLVIGLILDKLK